MRKIEITSGMNGYPAALRIGWVDFENFAEAEAYAEQLGGEVVHLRQRNGWAYWEEVGRAWAPYCLTVEDILGEDSSAELVTAANAAGWHSDARRWAEELAAEHEWTAEGLTEELAKIDRTAEHIRTTPDGLQAVVDGVEVVDVIPCESMGYRCDVWTYRIGVAEE